MATDIDNLQIKISGTAQGATKSINTLIKNLDRLQSSISRLDTSKFNSLSINTTKLSNSSSKLSTSLNILSTSATRNTKSFNGLASAFGRFYANYFLVIRGIKGLWSSIEGTADYIEAFNYYTVAFGKIASEWDKDWEKYGSENAKNYANSFVTSMNNTLGKLSGMQVSMGADGQGLISSTGAKNLGLNIQEITQYASQLASVTNSLGQTGQTTLAITDSFTKLAGDISSLFNVDYSTVATNLQSGLIGQSRALYKYGIDITNATLQTYAYQNGIDKAVSEMTQMEKQQLRVLAILDQSRVSFGDLANTINSPSNQIRQLTNNLEQLGIVLGQLFMPIVEKVLPVLNGLTIALRQLLVDIAGFMGVSIDFDKFGQGFTETEDGIGDITGELDDATESANELQNRLQGFDKLNILSTKSTVGGIDTSTIDLTQQIVDATSEYNKVWEEAFSKMENIAQDFAKKISKALEPVKKIFQDFAIGDYFQAGQDVSNLIVSINEFLTKALESVDWNKVGTDIGNFLAGLNWTEILSSFGDLFWKAINSSIEQWKSSFDAAPIETTIVTAIAGLTFTGLGPALLGTMARGLGTSITTAFTSPAFLAFFSAGGTGFIETAVAHLVTEFDLLLTQAVEGTWAEDILRVIGNALAGAVSGAVVGSWFPGAGTIVGAIIGGITGALNGIEIDGKSILSIITEKLFNFDSANYFWEKAKESFSTAFDGQRQGFFDIGGYIIDGIAEGLSAGLVYLGEPIADLFLWIWDGICGVFGIHSPAKEMKPLGEYILGGIVQGFSDSFSEFTDSISNFWEDYVKPWFSKDKWNFSGVEKGLSEAWQNGVDSIKQIWNKFANFLNSKLTWEIEPLVILGKTVFEGTTINLGKIPTFQTGGFPEDGLFFANHNELVGKFSNGQTAVANNEQIVGGIKQGVKEAVSEILAPYLADIADSSRRTANKNFGITGREVFSAVRTEADNYTRRTGQPAFI